MSRAPFLVAHPLRYVCVCVWCTVWRVVHVYAYVYVNVYVYV